MNTTQSARALSTDLERLAAALSPQQFATTLVTSPSGPPRLSIASRRSHASEDVYVDGGWFWFSWAERIAPVSDVNQAAHKISDVVSTTLPPIRPPRPLPEDGSAPNIARLYSFWRGGKDHLETDRQAGTAVIKDFPEVIAIAQANRQFVTRAVAYAAAKGIAQFVDIGAGLPTWPAVHENARDHTPTAAVAYLDNDPVVLAHARALYAAPGVSVIPGDLRYPKAILADPGLHAAIDLTQPVCLILAAILHFLRPAEADHALRILAGALAPGSYLMVSAGTSSGTDPALLERLRNAYAATTPIIARTHAEIEAWFNGFLLVRPGLVDVRDWRPGRQRPGPARASSGARFLAGVGVKHPPTP